jgi:hypothetical protein
MRDTRSDAYPMRGRRYSPPAPPPPSPRNFREDLGTVRETLLSIDPAGIFTIISQHSLMIDQRRFFSLTAPLPALSPPHPSELFQHCHFFQ